MHRSLTLLALTMTPLWGQSSGSTPRITLSRPAAVEGDTGSASSLVFELTREGSTASPLTIPYAFLEGTATAGTDFTARSTAAVTFEKGQSKASVSVPVLGDTEEEGDETVRLHFPEPSGYRVDGSWKEGETVGTGRGFLVRPDLALRVPADDIGAARGISAYLRGSGAGGKWNTIQPPFFGGNAFWGPPLQSAMLGNELISLSQDNSGGTGTGTGGEGEGEGGDTAQFLAVIQSFDATNPESLWGSPITVPLYGGGRYPASLSVSGERAAAGLTGLSGNEDARGRGQVSILKKTDDAEVPWRLEQVIESPVPNGVENAPGPGEFGSQVLLSGDTLVVSAPGAEAVKGVANVYIYRLVNGVWTLESSLLFPRQTGDSSHVRLALVRLDSAGLVVAYGDSLQLRARNTGGKNKWGVAKTRKLTGPAAGWLQAEADGADVVLASRTDTGSRLDTARADGKGGWLAPDAAAAVLLPEEYVTDMAISGPTMLRQKAYGESLPEVSLHDRNTAVGTILDDEFSILASDARVFEPASGAAVLRAPVTLSRRMGFPVTLSYSTTAGTAVSPADFTAVAAGTVTIPAGALTGHATVNVKADSAIENREEFSVTFSAPSAGRLERADSRGIIMDTDHPQFVKTSLPLTEPYRIGVDDVTPLPELKGMLKTAPAAALTLPFWVLGSADEGYDFTLDKSAFEFAPRSRTASVKVTVFPDEETEQPEYFFPVLIRDDAPPAGTRWVAGHAAEPFYDDGGETGGREGLDEGDGPATSDLARRDGVLAQTSADGEGGSHAIIWERDERGFFRTAVYSYLPSYQTFATRGPNTAVTESGEVLVAVKERFGGGGDGVRRVFDAEEGEGVAVLRWTRHSEGWNSEPEHAVSTSAIYGEPLLAVGGDWLALAGPSAYGNGTRLEIRNRNADGSGAYGLAISRDVPEGAYVTGLALDGDWLAMSVANEGVSQLRVYHRNGGGPDQWGEVKTLPGSGELHLSGATLMMRVSPLKARVYTLNDKTRAVSTGPEITFQTGGSARTELSGDRLLVRGADNSVTIRARNTGGANRWGVFSKVENTLSSEAPEAPVAFDGRTVITGLDGEAVAWYHPCEAAATIVDPPGNEGGGTGGEFTGNVSGNETGLVRKLAGEDPAAAAAWVNGIDSQTRETSSRLSAEEWLNGIGSQEREPRSPLSTEATASLTISAESPPVLSFALPAGSDSRRVTVTQGDNPSAFVNVVWREAGSLEWHGSLEWLGAVPSANGASTHRFRLRRAPTGAGAFRVSVE